MCDSQLPVDDVHEQASRMSALDLYEDLLIKENDNGDRILTMQEILSEKHSLEEQNTLLLQQLIEVKIQAEKSAEEKENLQRNFDALLATAKVELARKNTLLSRYVGGSSGSAMTTLAPSSFSRTEKDGSQSSNRKKGLLALYKGRRMEDEEPSTSGATQKPSPALLQHRGEKMVGVATRVIGSSFENTTAVTLQHISVSQNISKTGSTISRSNDVFQQQGEGEILNVNNRRVEITIAPKMTPEMTQRVNDPSHARDQMSNTSSDPCTNQGSDARSQMSNVRDRRNTPEGTSRREHRPVSNMSLEHITQNEGQEKSNHKTETQIIDHDAYSGESHQPHPITRRKRSKDSESELSRRPRTGDAVDRRPSNKKLSHIKPAKETELSRNSVKKRSNDSSESGKNERRTKDKDFGRKSKSQDEQERKSHSREKDNDRKKSYSRGRSNRDKSGWCCERRERKRQSKDNKRISNSEFLHRDSRRATVPHKSDRIFEGRNLEMKMELSQNKGYAKKENKKNNGKSSERTHKPFEKIQDTTDFRKKSIKSQKKVSNSPQSRGKINSRKEEPKPSSQSLKTENLNCTPNDNKNSHGSNWVESHPAPARFDPLNGTNAQQPTPRPKKSKHLTPVKLDVPKEKGTFEEKNAIAAPQQLHNHGSSPIKAEEEDCLNSHCDIELDYDENSLMYCDLMQPEKENAEKNRTDTIINDQKIPTARSPVTVRNPESYISTVTEINLHDDISSLHKNELSDFMEDDHPVATNASENFEKSGERPLTTNQQVITNQEEASNKYLTPVKSPSFDAATPSIATCASHLDKTNENLYNSKLGSSPRFQPRVRLVDIAKDCNLFECALGKRKISQESGASTPSKKRRKDSECRNKMNGDLSVTSHTKGVKSDATGGTGASCKTLLMTCKTMAENPTTIQEVLHSSPKYRASRNSDPSVTTPNKQLKRDTKDGVSISAVAKYNTNPRCDLMSGKGMAENSTMGVSDSPANYKKVEDPDVSLTTPTKWVKGDTTKASSPGASYNTVPVSNVASGKEGVKTITTGQAVLHSAKYRNGGNYDAAVTLTNGGTARGIESLPGASRNTVPDCATTPPSPVHSSSKCVKHCPESLNKNTAADERPAISPFKKECIHTPKKREMFNKGVSNVPVHEFSPCQTPVKMPTVDTAVENSASCDTTGKKFTDHVSDVPEVSAHETPVKVSLADTIVENSPSPSGNTRGKKKESFCSPESKVVNVVQERSQESVKNINATVNQVMEKVRAKLNFGVAKSDDGEEEVRLRRKSGVMKGDKRIGAQNKEISIWATNKGGSVLPDFRTDDLKVKEIEKKSAVDEMQREVLKGNIVQKRSTQSEISTARNPGTTENFSGLVPPELQVLNLKRNETQRDGSAKIRFTQSENNTSRNSEMVKKSTRTKVQSEATNTKAGNTASTIQTGTFRSSTPVDKKRSRQSEITTECNSETAKNSAIPKVQTQSTPTKPGHHESTIQAHTSRSLTPVGTAMIDVAMEVVVETSPSAEGRSSTTKKKKCRSHGTLKIKMKALKKEKRKKKLSTSETSSDRKLQNCCDLANASTAFDINEPRFDLDNSGVSNKSVSIPEPPPELNKWLASASKKLENKKGEKKSLKDKDRKKVKKRKNESSTKPRHKSAAQCKTIPIYSTAEPCQEWGTEHITGRHGEYLETKPDSSKILNGSSAPSDERKTFTSEQSSRNDVRNSDGNLKISSPQKRKPLLIDKKPFTSDMFEQSGRMNVQNSDGNGRRSSPERHEPSHSTAANTTGAMDSPNVARLTFKQPLPTDGKALTFAPSMFPKIGQIAGVGNVMRSYRNAAVQWLLHLAMQKLKSLNENAGPSFEQPIDLSLKKSLHSNEPSPTITKKQHPSVVVNLFSSKSTSEQSTTSKKQKSSESDKRHKKPSTDNWNSLLREHAEQQKKSASKNESEQPSNKKRKPRRVQLQRVEVPESEIIAKRQHRDRTKNDNISPLSRSLWMSSLERCQERRKKRARWSSEVSESDDALQSSIDAKQNEIDNLPDHGNCDKPELGAPVSARKACVPMKRKTDSEKDVEKKTKTATTRYHTPDKLKPSSQSHDLIRGASLHSVNDFIPEMSSSSWQLSEESRGRFYSFAKVIKVLSPLKMSPCRVPQNRNGTVSASGKYARRKVLQSP